MRRLFRHSGEFVLVMLAATAMLALFGNTAYPQEGVTYQKICDGRGCRLVPIARPAAPPAVEAMPPIQMVVAALPEQTKEPPVAIQAVPLVSAPSPYCPCPNSCTCGSCVCGYQRMPVGRGPVVAFPRLRLRR